MNIVHNRDSLVCNTPLHICGEYKHATRMSQSYNREIAQRSLTFGINTYTLRLYVNMTPF